jgi:lycopene cyclase domain-containing protein
MSQGPTAYLFHLCAWGLPLLAAQVFAVAWIHRGHFWNICRAVLPPSVIVAAWLVLGDQFAISAGIWRFGEGKHLGLYLLRVPIEEVLFFLLTNLLTAFGLVLLMRPRFAPRPR